MFLWSLFLQPPLIAWSLFASLTSLVTVSRIILVFARDAASKSSATSGLNDYGFSFQLVLVPQSGIILPTLHSFATNGNYGGIIVMNELGYEYSTRWRSVFGTAQWQQLYDYRTAFGVRMVRINVFPDPDHVVVVPSRFRVSNVLDMKTRCHHGNR
jgi:hypothetical protein